MEISLHYILAFAHGDCNLHGIQLQLPGPVSHITYTVLKHYTIQSNPVNTQLHEFIKVLHMSTKHSVDSYSALNVLQRFMLVKGLQCRICCFLTPHNQQISNAFTFCNTSLSVCNRHVIRPLVLFV